MVEEREGKLFGFEFKWSAAKKSKGRRAFLETYPGASLKIVSPENYLEFVNKK